MNSEAKIVIAVLAAGKASRMGRSKLTLPIGGTTLLDLALDAALGCPGCDTVAITGANKLEVDSVLASRGVKGVFNPQWADGQSASVKTAAHYAKQNGYDALMVLVGDQPHVRSSHLSKLIEAFRTDGAQSVVSQCGSRTGNPCLFSSCCFDLLLELTGDEGARSLLKKNSAVSVRAVRFDDELFFDVDTPEDLERAVKLLKSKA